MSSVFESHRPSALAAVTGPRAEAGGRTNALRAGLLLGGGASVAAAAWLGQPQPLLQADADLAMLLRGMAVIKAVLCGLVIGALLWRFGRPTTRRIATAYLVGAWLAAGASTLIWQLSFIPAAAVVFHLGELALLITMWRDRHAWASIRVNACRRHPPARRP